MQICKSGQIFDRYFLPFIQPYNYTGYWNTHIDTLLITTASILVDFFFSFASIEIYANFTNQLPFHPTVREDLLIDLDMPPATRQSTPVKKADPLSNMSILDAPIDVPELSE